MKITKERAKARTDRLLAAHGIIAARLKKEKDKAKKASLQARLKAYEKSLSNIAEHNAETV